MAAAEAAAATALEGTGIDEHFDDDLYEDDGSGLKKRKVSSSNFDLSQPKIPKTEVMGMNMGMGIPDMLLCTEMDCGKKAADGTGKCVIHGGVRRCDEIGCGKGAVGTSNKCVAHGGGRRCLESGCNKSSVSSSGKCVAHGGGRRCQEEVSHCLLFYFFKSLRVYFSVAFRQHLYFILWFFLRTRTILSACFYFLVISQCFGPFLLLAELLEGRRGPNRQVHCPRWGAALRRAQLPQERRGEHWPVRGPRRRQALRRGRLREKRGGRVGQMQGPRWG